MNVVEYILESFINRGGGISRTNKAHDLPIFEDIGVSCEVKQFTNWIENKMVKTHRKLKRKIRLLVSLKVFLHPSSKSRTSWWTWCTRAAE